MTPLMYGELVPWYRMMDPTEDHRDEAASYEAALVAAVPAARTLLDLGAGAGNNAWHLKRRFTCTLSDVATDMLALSRDINPECEHAVGDMRSLRLERTFDTVLVHDAIMYMTTEADLQDAIRTAYLHTRPGGAAVFAPDLFRETFAEATELIEGDDGARALRGMSWMWDPVPGDTTFAVDYTFLLRDGSSVRAVHDRHVEGMFSEQTWRDLLAGAGFEVGTFPRPIGDGAFDRCFLCRRPT
jgi:trans-aconitate methyltransferase